MRKVLREGTWIRLSQGELYKITGTPVGEGGGSIVYPCKKISHFNGKITVSEIDYALKECFPLSSAFVFERREDGEIVSATENPAAVRYLNSVRKMQMQEQEITGKICAFTYVSSSFSLFIPCTSASEINGQSFK